jgi:hypothetical protein
MASTECAERGKNCKQTSPHFKEPELTLQINYRQLSRALKVHTHLAKQYGHVSNF